jgi:hypothetical protein
MLGGEIVEGAVDVAERGATARAEKCEPDARIAAGGRASEVRLDVLAIEQPAGQRERIRTAVRERSDAPFDDRCPCCPELWLFGERTFLPQQWRPASPPTVFCATRQLARARDRSSPGQIIMAAPRCLWRASETALGKITASPLRRLSRAEQAGRDSGFSSGEQSVAMPGAARKRSTPTTERAKKRRRENHDGVPEIFEATKRAVQVRCGKRFLSFEI